MHIKKIMSARLNINSFLNKKINRLTILSEVEGIHNGKRNYRCVIAKCDCGKEVKSRLHDIRYGNTQSCGCYKSDMIKKAQTKHGKRRHHFYAMWKDIRYRCLNPNCKAYKYYGGRGIKMCDEWLNNVDAFFTWANNGGWQKGLQIDRIDNNGNYEPSNCRFVTPKENTRNTRASKKVLYNDKLYPIGELADANNIPVSLFRNRLKLKWPIEKIISMPVRALKKTIQSVL